ncbi:MAG: PIN domain-containing protein [Chloroflexi bacterium]|nr:PIN domain-containing protein [Chloroflexota bacterium]
MAQHYVLDTNIVTGILKKDARVVSRLRQALAANAMIALSPVVFYEVKRGLLKKDAHKQMGFFEKLANTFQWDDLQRPDWDSAAQIWAAATRVGHSPSSDADLLIATHARRLNAVVVTDNERHFARLGVQIENWLA